MKKIAICAFAAISLMLAACGGNNADAFIKDYRNLCNEYKEAVKEGNTKKVKELDAKANEFKDKYKDLDEKDFTEEQKKEILEITQELMVASLSNAGLDTSLDEAADDASEE